MRHLTTIMVTTLLMCFIWSVTGCFGPVLAPKAYEAPTGFLLGPEDELEITVWGNKDLTRITAVRPDGLISMPIIGDVQAAGLTADALAQRIADRLHGHTQRVGLGAVDLRAELRHVGLIAGDRIAEAGHLADVARDLGNGALQLAVAEPGAVLHIQGEARAGADAENRRRQQREAERLLDLGELCVELEVDLDLASLESLDVGKRQRIVDDR